MVALKLYSSQGFTRRIWILHLKNHKERHHKTLNKKILHLDLNLEPLQIFQSVKIRIKSNNSHVQIHSIRDLPTPKSWKVVWVLTRMVKKNCNRLPDLLKLEDELK